MTRGEMWLAHVGRESRRVLVLTRPEVIDVRRLVNVAEITTSIRGIAAERSTSITRGAGSLADQPSTATGCTPWRRPR
jgi:hypothetical protein